MAGPAAEGGPHLSVSRAYDSGKVEGVAASRQERHKKRLGELWRSTTLAGGGALDERKVGPVTGAPRCATPLRD